MNTVTIELNFSAEQINQLSEIARERQMIIPETIQLVVAEWLEKERRLTNARRKMRQLGRGLGKGRPPHDTAQNHDAYLYKR